MKGGRFAFWNDQFYFKTQAKWAPCFPMFRSRSTIPWRLWTSVSIWSWRKTYCSPTSSYLRSFIHRMTFATPYLGRAPKADTGNHTRNWRALEFRVAHHQNHGLCRLLLIVADFINHGKDIGVFIGPGRGSAAGSAVAYCIGITNIDPIKIPVAVWEIPEPRS